MMETTTWPFAVVVVVAVVSLSALLVVAGLCRMALRHGARFRAGIEAPSLFRFYLSVEPQPELESDGPHSLAGDKGSSEVDG